MGKIYHFPPLTVNRLVREAIASHYLQLLKYPDLSKPFEKLDPKTMDWPQLQGLLLSTIRHRYSTYGCELAAGVDRETLHREIHAAAFKQFPFLRNDPRPFRS
jgi:hypothetical protein